jgi:hypothetical protein
MFLAWQDLQLLHATHPGLQYKHKFGGNKSWKVSSLGGVDRIELLGYPKEEKPIVIKPKIRQRKKIFIWPAFEVTDISGNDLGIVICRGGGFEPPYEFISSQDIPDGKLPEDLPDAPAGELPEKRNWRGIPRGYNVNSILYEDLETAGIAELDTAYTRAWTYENSSTESVGAPTNLYCGTDFTDEIVNAEACVNDYGYEASFTAKLERAAALKVASRTQTEAASVDLGFSYSLEGDPDLG